MPPARAVFAVTLPLGPVAVGPRMATCGAHQVFGNLCWLTPIVKVTIRQMNPGMREKIASNGPLVVRILLRLPKTIAIYAFGSQAHGTAGPDSDLDLAVLVAGYADPLALWSLADDLADLAGCPVDLLDLRAASTVMQYQVITAGRCMWSAGLNAGLFECFVLSEKTELDTARAPLMADILASGRVHG